MKEFVLSAALVVADVTASSVAYSPADRVGQSVSFAPVVVRDHSFIQVTVTDAVDGSPINADDSDDSWGSNPSWACSAFREPGGHLVCNNQIGFRVARP